MKKSFMRQWADSNKQEDAESVRDKSDDSEESFETPEEDLKSEGMQDA